MKTKIVATIGPKSENELVLSQMIAAGMNIARMNFSHCTPEEFKKRVAIIREESKRQGKEVAILQDLQGPRIRTGIISDTGRELKKGEEVVFTNHEEEGKIFIDEPSLVDVIEVGHTIFLANGDMELKVNRKLEGGFAATVIHGGVLYSRKGVNVPDTKVPLEELTKKDLQDLDLGLSVGVDYVAISFVQSGEDVRKAKEIIGGRAQIISKIESAQGLKNIDDIIRESDGIMIARGDLGIEIPMEEVPFFQKDLIRRAHSQGKWAIVATQILLSMKENPKPTRAEVSDAFNAVLDGADVLMLSDETSSMRSQYPLEAVEMLVRIAKRAESNL